jgi:hypothetical protein
MIAASVPQKAIERVINYTVKVLAGRPQKEHCFAAKLLSYPQI